MGSTSATCKPGLGGDPRWCNLPQAFCLVTWRVRSLFFVQGCQMQRKLRLWEPRGHYKPSFLRRQLLGTPRGKQMFSKSYCWVMPALEWTQKAGSRRLKSCLYSKFCTGPLKHYAKYKGFWLFFFSMYHLSAGAAASPSTPTIPPLTSPFPLPVQL